MDNLRQFLTSYDISLPHFLGSRFAHNRLLKGYFGGGAGIILLQSIFLAGRNNMRFQAGYVMTRETVRIFVEHVYNNGFDACINGHNGEEDSYLGRKYFKNVIMSIILDCVCSHVSRGIRRHFRRHQGSRRGRKISSVESSQSLPPIWLPVNPPRLLPVEIGIIFANHFRRPGIRLFLLMRPILFLKPGTWLLLERNNFLPSS